MKKPPKATDLGDVLSEARAWQERKRDIRDRVAADLSDLQARASQLTELLAELDGGAPAPRKPSKPFTGFTAKHVEKIDKMMAKGTAKGSPFRKWFPKSRGKPVAGSVGSVKGTSRWRYQIRLDGKYYSKAFASRGEAKAALAVLKRECAEHCFS